jgi:hypothetical protein
LEYASAGKDFARAILRGQPGGKRRSAKGQWFASIGRQAESTFSCVPVMSSSAYDGTDRQKTHAVQSSKLSSGWNVVATHEFGLLGSARDGTAEQPDGRPTALVIEFF